jgi:hypothetical protein
MRFKKAAVLDAKRSNTVSQIGAKKLITVDADKTTNQFIQIEHKQNQAAQQRNA